MGRGAGHVVVVGAGPAGTAAAIEAARSGLRVTLVDEHPQPVSAMSLDAPYFYGARVASVLASTRAVAEQVLNANEGLAECLESGVEVLTGTCAWGVFAPGPNSRHVGARQVALADGERSWCLAFDHLVLAPGARDLVLSFPGWELPGVLGVKAAMVLLESYRAFEARRVVVLGSGNAALAFAARASERGIELAGIVEAAPRVQGDAALARSLEDAGVPFFLGHTIERALGTHAVETARLVARTGNGAVDVPCDTICMAFGVVPNVELAAVADCALHFDPSLGGWVPGVGADGASSVPGVHVVGDAAGVTEPMLLDASIAMAQGRAVARAIAARDGVAPAPAEPVRVTGGGAPVVFPPAHWIDALVAAGGMDVVVCQCEEMTRRDLVELRPPAYLAAGDGHPPGALQTAVAGGRVSQDFVKRMTRVGMGHCQGKRCRDHAALLLARAAGVPLSEVVPGSYRVPVRPLRLAVMQAHDEPDDMRSRWPMWLHPTDGPPCSL